MFAQGRRLSCLLLAAAGILILWLAGKILYQVQIRGSLLLAGAAGLLSMTSMFSMGFFFTAVGKGAKISHLLCYLSYFLMLFLSGATVPDLLFPESVQKIAGLLPMTYAVDLMQGIFAGDGLGMHKKELLVLGGLTIVFTAAGALLYRKKDWA